MTSLVSVIIPTHRRGDVLDRALRSVLDQTHADLEVVVVDDGPDAATRAFVENYPDERVRYLGHSRNLGVAAARNTGIRAATGRFIAFLDDDDEWRQTKIEQQVALLEARPDVGVVTCYEEWERDGVLRRRAMHLDGDVRSLLLRHDRVLLQTLLVRREVFDEIGLFDERLWNFQDMDLALRIARVTNYATVPECLMIGHVTTGSLSNTTPKRIRSLQVFIDKHPEIRTSRRMRSHWLHRLARLQAELGWNDQWRASLTEALRANPANLRAGVALAIGLIADPTAHIRLAKFRGRITRVARNAWKAA